MLRTFLVAIGENDEATIRRVAIDRAGIEILWGGTPLADRDRRQLIEGVKSMPLRRLQVGDTITVPMSRGPVTVTLDADDINDGRAMILFAGAPIPNVVLKVDGEWKADPGALIAAREAARKYRNAHTRPAASAPIAPDNNR